jgi:Tfp pilus assembly protein PilV
MFRHPRCLEIPWKVHWDQKEQEPHHHLLLTLILILVAMFLIGVGVTSGLM